MPLVFVYGTLMRGQCRHAALAAEEFVGTATTRPEYRLYDCGSYPGLIEVDNGVAIEGEVWRVSRACLAQLNDVEGVAENLYERRPIALEKSFGWEPVEAYFYRQDISTFAEVGKRWST